MAELTAREELNQMINGTHKNREVTDINEDEDEFEEVETEETTEVEESESEIDDIEETENDIEDTDQETDTEEEEDTDQESDGSTEDTSETAEEDQEEDTQTSEEESEETSDDAEEINYKEFYEKVALAKFTANGKEVEGFKNPEDLVRAQQMLHGYSDKMKVFKEYKKFLKPLEERGMVSDPDKFNLAMSLLDGDPEAIKKVLKEKNMDPMEFDLEDIQYTPKNTLPSSAQMLIEEAQEQAVNLGIGDKFNNVIGRDWDVPSLQEFVKDGKMRSDLLTHLQNGTYDIVQNEVNRMELLDSSGILDDVSSVEKYRMAMARLNQQRPAPAKVVKPAEVVVDKVAEAKKAEEFKKKAAAKEAKIAEDRKKAASMSKKKMVKKPKKAPAKLEELQGDDFKAAFRNMLMS